jgi:hypothetical protein
MARVVSVSEKRWRGLRRWVAVVAGGLLATSALVGCSAVPAVQTALPAGVSVSLFQNRSDYPIRHLEVQIHNTTKSTVTIRSGTFSSTFFAKAVALQYVPYDLEPGDQVAFPVALPAAACDRPKPAPRVTVDFTDSAGKGSATVTPKVLYNTLGEIHSHDCALGTFEKVVAITPGDAVTWSKTASGALVSHLDMTFTPTGAAGSVTLNSIDNTTLLDMSLDTTYPLVLSASSAPLTLTLSATPSRCETHALGEDKIGTVVPFHVTTSAYSNGYFGLVLSNTLKFEYYHYFALACGYPPE